MEEQVKYEYDSLESSEFACKHKRRKPHKCLYRSEIDGDNSVCTCCKKCTEQCCDDI